MTCTSALPHGARGKMAGGKIGIGMTGIGMTGIKMIGMNLIIVAKDEEEVKET